MARWLILSRRYLRASAREVKYLVPIVPMDRLDGEFVSGEIHGTIGKEVPLFGVDFRGRSSSTIISTSATW